MTGKKRILVVDDDPAFRSMLAVLLRRSNYDVETAEDGDRGLERAQSWQPNLMLIDWMMPGLTGPELCRAIRQDPYLHHIYLIMLTAKAGAEDVIRGLDEGADEYVVKPISNAELLARVRAGLRVQKLQEELAAQYAAAARERARLETVLSSVGGPIIVLDDKGRIESVNQATRELFGGSRVVIEGKHIDDLADGSLGALWHNVRANSKTVAASEVTLRNRHVYTVRFTPFATDHGSGWVATLQDITHLKELDRLKTQALQQVAHDVKSPLARVRGFVEALEYLGPLNEAQQDAQQSALQGADLIRDLVVGLLDLEKIEAGLCERQLVDLAALASEVVNEFRLQAETQHVTLELEEQEKLPQLSGDRLRLSQALRNLIDNALKYTPTGGRVKVTITRAGTEAVIAVADTGCGVPAEALPHLFDRFYRVPGQAATNGTGLGLTIVKSVVEVHGGRVWVESTPGQGATFYIALPIVPAEETTTEWQPRSLQRPSRHRFTHKAPTVRQMMPTS